MELNNLQPFTPGCVPSLQECLPFLGSYDALNVSDPPAQGTTGNDIDPNGVAHPSHYNSHPSGVECIKVVQHHNFNVGNAIKYLWRQGLKGSEWDVKDLRKARQYIQFEIERLGHEA